MVETSLLTRRIVTSWGVVQKMNTRSAFVMTLGFLLSTAALLSPCCLFADELDDADVKTRRFDSPIHNVALRGGNLVLHLKDENKLAFFSPKRMGVDFYYQVPHDAIFTASSDRVFVYSKSKRELEVLQGFKPVRKAPLPEGNVIGLFMGSLARVPLLVMFEEDGLRHGRFYNAQTLQPLEPIRSFPLSKFVRPSSDGTFIISTGPHDVADKQESSTHFIQLTSRKVQFKSFSGWSWQWPTNLSDQTLADYRLHRKLPSNIVDEKILVSSQNGAFRLGFSGTTDAFAGRRPTKASLYLGSEKLADLPWLKVMFETVDKPWRQHLEVSQRVHLFPGTNQIVVIPRTLDRVLVRPFDFEKIYEAATSDFLFVESSPTPAVIPGGRYFHNLVVRRKKPPAFVKLESGPEGMRVSPSGKITGYVPKDVNDSVEVRIRVTAEDKSFLHTMLLHKSKPFPYAKPVSLAIHQAARKGDLEELKEQILRDRRSVRQADPKTLDTPLHIAVRHQQYRAAGVLLDEGAERGTRNGEGRAPWMEAVLLDDVRMLQVFVRNASYKSRLKTLDLWKMYFPSAVNHCKPNIVEHIVSMGASLDEQMAYSAKNAEALKFALSLGADPNARAGGRTALYRVAGKDGNLESVKLLIEKGAHVNEPGPGVTAPLRMAVSFGHADIMRTLVAGGAKTDIVGTRHGGNLLHLAAEQGHLQLVKPLVDWGVDINEIDNRFLSPLVATIQQELPSEERLKRLTALIENGADVKEKTGGRTPIEWASKAGHEDVVEVLKKHGAK